MDEPDNIYLRAIRELREDVAAVRQDVKHLALRVSVLEKGFTFVQEQNAVVIEMLTDLKAGQDEVKRRLGLIGAPV